MKYKLFQTEILWPFQCFVRSFLSRVKTLSMRKGRNLFLSPSHVSYTCITLLLTSVTTKCRVEIVRNRHIVQPFHEDGVVTKKFIFTMSILFLRYVINSNHKSLYKLYKDFSFFRDRSVPFKKKVRLILYYQSVCPKWGLWKVWCHRVLMVRENTRFSFSWHSEITIPFRSTTPQASVHYGPTFDWRGWVDLGDVCGRRGSWVSRLSPLVKNSEFGDRKCNDGELLHGQKDLTFHLGYTLE